LTHSLFIFAGEMSADLHGEKLILKLQQQNPSLKIFGVGGPRMRQTGMECILPMEAFQVMGFIDILSALPRLMKHFFFVKKTILERNPTAALFIDYAEFNMFMETALRKKKYAGKLIHYISPSVWAWRKNRMHTLAKNLDLLLVIYPFEVPLFSNTPFKVEYVGHPLIPRLKEHTYKTGLFPTDKTILSLFPGSRQKEIQRNLPLMLRVCKDLSYPNLLIVISLSHPRFKNTIEQLLKEIDLPHPIQMTPAENNYELMKASHIALAKSGTVTLELALHEVPTVVVYEISLLDKYIGRDLLRILLPYYCIVNILLNEQVFPEFFNHNIDPLPVRQRLQDFLSNPALADTCKQKCCEIKSLLTQKNTHEEAARSISLLIK
jgi:lipid-A-disaccharide synthase